MVQRTIILLACGPGAADVYESGEAEVSKAGSGSNSWKMAVPIGRSIWSACVEAGLEYTRVVYDLLPKGAGVSFMVADKKSGGVARALNSWSPKEQTMPTIVAALEQIEPSSQAIDGPAAAAAAAQALVSGLDQHRQPLAGKRRSGCRIVFIATLPALGCDNQSEGGFDAASIEKEIQRAARVVWTRLQPPADLEVKLDMVWVSKDGPNWPRNATTAVSPAQVKRHICSVVQSHMLLQSVRITGIPMNYGDKGKDGEGGKTESKTKSIYEVQLLCLAEHGDPGERMLEWQPLKALEKQVNFNIYSSRSIKRSTALDLTERHTQVLIKHLKTKPAALVPAGATVKSGGSSGEGSKTSNAEGGATSANSNIPPRLLVVRDFMGGVFLHDMLLNEGVIRIPPQLSVEDASSAINPQMEVGTVAALDERMRDMIRCAALPVHKSELAAVKGQVLDAEVSEPVPHITSSYIERRTRYLPLSESSSALFANSTDKERSLRTASTKAAGAMIVGEVVVGKGGEMTAAKKQPIRGLKEFVETCTQTSVLEQVIVVAVETVGRVHKMWQQAQTGGVVNGWGLYELKELWNEICKMGTECARLPCTAGHQRIMGALRQLGGLTSDVPESDGQAKAEAHVGAGKRKAEQQGGRGPRVRRAHDVPLDDKGRPLLPLQLGQVVTIHSLGQVRSGAGAESFHSDKYIWPIGYRSARQFWSVISNEPDKKCEYTCEILDGGGKPLFRVTPSDAPHISEVAYSASGAWSAIMKKVNIHRTSLGQAESKTAVSGPEYYGLAYPEVKKLIQGLPGAKNCATTPIGHGCYKWQDFGDAHSAAAAIASTPVIPAKQQESDVGGSDEKAGDEEEQAWKALKEFKSGLQSSGRDGAGIDNPDVRRGGPDREILFDDGGLSNVRKYPEGSVFRTYWEAYVGDESRKAAVLDCFVDPSRITGR